MRATSVIGFAGLLAVATPSACTDEVADLAVKVAPLGAGGGSVTSSGAAGAGGGEVCLVGSKPCAVLCDRDLGCVACMADDDCGKATPRCVLGRCVACATSSDCPEGQACFPKDRTCHPRCMDMVPCPPDQSLCDAVTGACVGCLAASDCPSDKPICDPTRAQCGACTSRSDCSAETPACDLTHGQCVDCLVDLDCAAPALCAADHHCHGGCLSDVACTDATKPKCDVATKRCVQCLAANDCPPEAPNCFSGQCSQNPPP